MSAESFWEKCGVLSIDHFAVTTNDLNAVIIDYLGLPGSSLLRGPGYNESQNVDFAFIKLSSGECIEILGLKVGSPISEHVSKGGGAYHICFIVEDIDLAINIAESEGAVLVTEPKVDEVFSPRRISFMMHPNHGLFEFLESYPKESIKPNKLKKNSPKNSNLNRINKKSLNSMTLEAFYNTFTSLKSDDQIFNASYESLAEWDSLKHLMLIMEIEKICQISFSASEISKVKSFSEIIETLKKKVG